MGRVAHPFTVALFPVSEMGAPSLRFLQGRVPPKPVRWVFLCLPDCIALTALTTCTLSPVLVITDDPNCAPGVRATVSYPFLNKLANATASWSSDMWSCPSTSHLLMTEPEGGTPSTVLQVLKQRTAHALLSKKKRSDPRQQVLFPENPRLPFWQARFYDFQRLDDQEADREAPVHASQSSQARTGHFARTVALEQLPLLLAGRTRTRARQRRLGKDFVYA